MSEINSPAPWAVVLGASSGSGEAVARAVARSPGLNIFGVHRGNWPESAEELRAHVESLGRVCAFAELDASSADAAEAGVQALAEVAPAESVGLFVHSIASASVGRLASGPEPLHPRQMRATFERMAHSFVYWVQALVRHRMLAPGAQLLGLSNPMTEAVIRDTALIAASKAALEQYVRHLAFELGPQGYRVNLLKYGLVVTPAVRRTFGEDALSRLTSVVTRAVPARRLCSLDELGDMVSFLAGPNARWFNGATIDFTGGESHAFFDSAMHPDGPERDGPMPAGRPDLGSDAER